MAGAEMMLSYRSDALLLIRMDKYTLTHTEGKEQPILSDSCSLHLSLQVWTKIQQAVGRNPSAGNTLFNLRM